MGGKKWARVAIDERMGGRAWEASLLFDLYTPGVTMI